MEFEEKTRLRVTSTGRYLIEEDCLKAYFYHFPPSSHSEKSESVR